MEPSTGLKEWCRTSYADMKRPLRYIKVKNLVAEQLTLHDSIHVLKFSKKGNTGTIHKSKVVLDIIIFFFSPNFTVGSIYKFTMIPKKIVSIVY